MFTLISQLGAVVLWQKRTQRCFLAGVVIVPLSLVSQMAKNPVGYAQCLKNLRNVLLAYVCRTATVVITLQKVRGETLRPCCHDAVNDFLPCSLSWLWRDE